MTKVNNITTKRNSKANKNVIYMVIGMAIAVLMCLCTKVDEASAADVPIVPMDSNAIVEMAEKNDGSLFMVGEIEISKDVSVAEVVQQYNARREAILNPAICLYARNNQEMKPTQENVMELRNQFTYSEQEITVRTDIISGETKVLLERVEESGRICQTIYTFDCITYQPDVYSIDRVVEFHYLGFRYVIYIENNKFEICSVWDPEVGTRVIDVNDANNMGEANYLKWQFNNQFGGKFKLDEIEFIEEQGAYVKIHMYVTVEGCKYEYVFYTYNAKPIDEAIEIVAVIHTNDDDYTIYESDGWICLDSAKRAGYVDHPNAVRS